jgi:AbrB family looped-hinge helix DNA binding protein
LSEVYMRITEKGQVTIPVRIRERFGLLPHTEVEFVEDEDGVRLKPIRTSGRQDRGRMIVNRLRGTATGGMSTDEIMALTRGE